MSFFSVFFFFGVSGVDEEEAFSDRFTSTQSALEKASADTVKALSKISEVDGMVACIPGQILGFCVAAWKI